MSFSKIFASLLLPLLLFTGCDREEEARFARVTVEFEDVSGVPITELFVPYFRVVAEEGWIGSVYSTPEGQNLGIDSMVIYSDGKVSYSVFAVPGAIAGIDVGNGSTAISFPDPSTDSTVTLPLCFLSSVPFREVTDFVAGRSYLVRIPLNLELVHEENDRVFVDGRNVVAEVE